MKIEQRTPLAIKQGRLRARRRRVRGIILHTTGSGPWVRWKGGTGDSPYEAAQYIYESISPYCAHYLVDGESGAVTQFVPHRTVAWHVGSSGSALYRKQHLNIHRYSWWKSRFPGLDRSEEHTSELQSH